MKYNCPWCGKESDYFQESDYRYSKGRTSASKTETVESMACDYIFCVCPECGGKFTLEPQLKVECVYIWGTDDDGVDWGEDYHDYGELRKDYYERENRPKTKTFSLSGFSLAPPGGFSLNPQDRFSLAPPGGFSLKSRRRRR